jgi:SEC-C motif
MPKRSVGVYPGEDDEILVSFEKGCKGVPLKSLLPEDSRGQKFGDFDVSGYFGFAQMVLVTPEEWRATCEKAKSRPEFKSAVKTSPIKFNPPAPNLDYLRLRTSAGGMDAERTAELFKVVAAYWQQRQDMALEPGIVAAAWHKGMTAAGIVKFVRDNTQIDPKSGQSKLVFPKVSLDVKLMSSLLPLEITHNELTPAKADRLVERISSLQRGHAAFAVPKRKSDDISFLGLVDESGTIDRTATDAARDYIWAQIDQPPDYPALWRHIQTTKGVLSAPDPTADYNPFNLHIAELADNDVDNLALVKAILALAETDTAVPTERLYRATRVVWELERVSEKDRSAMETSLKQQPLDLGRWLAFDRATLFTREPQKMIVSGTPKTEIEAFLESQISKAGSAQTLQDFKNHYFKEGFVETLRDLGVVDDHGQWSEVGFVRQQMMMQAAQQKGIPPSLEWLRWALHHRYHAEEPVPFAWTLQRDRLPTKTIQRARCLASMALSGGMTGQKFQIDEVITPEQFQILWKFGAWLSDDVAVYLNYEYPDLGWMAKYAQHPRLRLEDWREICDFVFGKLNQAPDPALLREQLERKGIIVPDWREYGHQKSSPKSFNQGEKVGRNDPCPCNSGKKFKKCCGR